MRGKDLTVEVTARLAISDETAERCCRLLEMWLTDNPDAHIYGEKDGPRTVLRIKKEARNG